MILEVNKKEINFPHPNTANKDGIVAWGGDLNPYRLIKAYQLGIFPWYSHRDPILWWSPNPRLIMELDDFKLSKSLKKSIKKFTYKFNANFKEVMQNCASKQRKGQDGTWIQKDLIEAYEVLHSMGIAHSVETYKDGVLVGGLYGLTIGKVFCGESMFANESDASKSAYAVMVKHLKKWGYDFIDCQVPTDHLKSLGAKEVDREYFLEKLYRVNKESIRYSWTLDKTLLD
ncbi:MAG: leucyl/phenylalanyl-tRNA--protein transferase [Sulfurimonas sp.]|uniref:leucyl/phenylalanyl-tRNA--protein transferase n=1 Tax=Sulfurimonas sp. TaxID=2022749 RepID=UPI0039E6CE34